MPLAGAEAAFIQSGNPVVMRIDKTNIAVSGTGNLRGTKAWLDEYDANTGNWVQSWALPTGSGSTSGADPTAFTEDISAQEGVLTTTPDQSKIVFAGYRWKALTAVTSRSPIHLSTMRGIGTLGLDGTLDTSFNAPVPSSVTLGSNTRSAASADGSTFYIGTGYGGGTPTAGLVYYATSGQPGTIVGGRNVRNIGFANIGGSSSTLVSSDGQTSGSITDKLRSYGAAPTSLVGSPSALVNVTGSLQGFAFADLNPGIAGDDTLYLIQNGGGTNGNGIQKYSFDGTNWNFVNAISVGTLPLNIASYPLANGSINLFVTSESALYKLTDTAGYGGSLPNSLTQLTASNAALIPGGANDGTNILFRGVAVVPEPTSIGLLGIGLMGLLRRRQR